MNLADISRQLSHGELSQLAFGKELMASPSNARITQLVDHVNLALLSLYKRFDLKEMSKKVPLFPLIECYTIEDPSLLKIIRVAGEMGEDFPLNDSSDKYSCHTPKTKVLQIAKEVVAQASSLPEKYKTSAVTVSYRASHPILVASEVIEYGLEETEVELPYAYLQALLYSIASRVHNPVGMVNEFNAGNNWFAKYEGECKRLETEGLDIDSLESNTRLQRGGWV